MPKAFLRKSQVRERIPVGKTTLEEKILPRLDKVRLGARIVAYTEESVDRVCDELIAESATIPDFVPTPNTPTAKRRRRAEALSTTT